MPPWYNTCPRLQRSSAGGGAYACCCEAVSLIGCCQLIDMSNHLTLTGCLISLGTPRARVPVLEKVHNIEGTPLVCCGISPHKQYIELQVDRYRRPKPQITNASKTRSQQIRKRINPSFSCEYSRSLAANQADHSIVRLRRHRPSHLWALSRFHALKSMFCSE